MKKGFLMVEVIASIAILSIVVVSILPIFYISQSHSKKANDRIEESLNLKNFMEENIGQLYSGKILNFERKRDNLNSKIIDKGNFYELVVKDNKNNEIKCYISKGIHFN